MGYFRLRIGTAALLAPLACIVALAGPALASPPPMTAHIVGTTASYTGTFANDADQREFFFTLGSAGSVTIRTFSYAGGTNGAGATIPAGGFDPTLTVYDASGTTLLVNQDGGCGLVGKDPVTSSCWDAYISSMLPAGTYRVLLTQSSNLPAGPALSDSFIYNPNNLFNASDLVNGIALPPFGGLSNFTQPPGNATGGFWDFFPNQRTASFALDIVGAPSVMPAVSTSATLPFGIAGTTIAPINLMVQSGTGVTYTWTPPNSGLPPGLSMNTSGVVSGTPTMSGTYMFTALATDGIQPVQQTETIIVYNPLSITTTSLPSGLRGNAYSQQLSIAGGSGSVMWTASGLSGGMALSTSGLLTGSPTGSIPLFTVTATDTVTGQTAMKSYTIAISAPPLTVSGGGVLSEAAVGAQLSISFGANGGTPPFTFTSQNLPPGLTLGSGSGSLTGVPSVPGNYSFTVNVADSGGQSGLISAVISILGFKSTTLPAASTTAAYSFTFAGAGGSGSYSYSASGLPAGLSFTAGGVLSGTPTKAGTPTFTVTVNDGVITASATISLTVNGPMPLSLPGISLNAAQANISYTATLSAAGGTSPYSWTVIGGTLPTGLALSGTGVLSGTPTVAGTYSFTAQVTDLTGAMISGSFTVVVNPAPLKLISSNTLPSGVVGATYPIQIFTANGGTPNYTFSISAGSLPAGLTFSNGQITGTPSASGTFNFTVLVTDSNSQTASIPLSIVVAPVQANLILSDTFLSFAVMTGSTALPSFDTVTVRSSNVMQPLTYSYTLSPSVSWLSVSGGTTTPGSLSVSLTSAALALSASSVPYTTSLQVSCASPSPCAGQTQTVSISLSVTAPPAALGLTSTLLSFSSTTANPASVSLPLGVQNTGGGSLGIGSVTTGSSWVSVSGVPGAVTSGPPVSITVTVSPAGLPPGTSTSSVTVNSSAGSLTVPVSLYISNNTVITLSPAAGQFSLTAGATLSPSVGSFQVTANATVPVSWSAAVLAGAPWLSTSTPSGTSTASSAGTVSFAIDPTQAAQLPQGTAYGTIRVTSTAATDSPQDFQVAINVASPSTLALPTPSPAGLVFTSGGVSSQSVTVYASSATAVSYQASAATTDGATWLSVSPQTGAASAGTPGASTVSVNTAGLPPGTYTGLVSYAFSAADVASVNVTLLITGAGGLAEIGPSARATTCAPKSLAPTQIGLVSNFLLNSAIPAPLSVLVKDNCGNAIPGGQVTVTFSNGDAPLTLTPVDNVSGIFDGTWTPVGVSPQVSVTATVTASGLTSGKTQTNGVVAASRIPLLTQNGVLHVYAPKIGAAVAPGNILQIYGSNLAAAAVTSSTVPLTTTLGGTSVSIGGIPAPLYYVSPGQINVEAPFELRPGGQYQVIATVNGAQSAPQTITVAAAVPGIAAYANGQIVAQHLNGTLISEASPAQPGSYVILYLAGLGATDTPVADGAGSPASPLAHPVLPPVLTLNGVSQPYQFVGLTPGIVGLYQINFQVPANTANGDMQLVVSQSGVASNSVILPVHQ